MQLSEYPERRRQARRDRLTRWTRALPSRFCRAIRILLVALSVCTFVEPVRAQDAFGGLAAVTSQSLSVPIPDSQAEMHPPKKWNTGIPGPDVSLLFESTDGAAQLSVTVMHVDNDMTLTVYRNAIEAAIHENMLAIDLVPDARGMETVERAGLLYRLFGYTMPDPEDPILVTICSVWVEDALIVLHGSVFASAQSEHVQLRDSCLSVSRRRAGGDRTAASPSVDRVQDREHQLMEQLRYAYTESAARELAALRADQAQAYLRDGDAEMAFACLNSAVELSPEDPELLECLGDVLDFIAEPAAPYLAQSYYEQALNLDPARRGCRIKLAASYMATGAMEAGRDHYEILSRNGTGPPDGRFIQELSLCYLSTQEAHTGAEFMAEMVQSGGGPQFSVALAVLLKEMGQFQDAAAMARYAAQVASDPAFCDYASALAERFEAMGGAQ